MCTGEHRHTLTQYSAQKRAWRGRNESRLSPVPLPSLRTLPSKYDSFQRPLNSTTSFKKKKQLEYNCLTVLCSFLLKRTGNQSCVYTCPLLLEASLPSRPHPTLQVLTGPLRYARGSRQLSASRVAVCLVWRVFHPHLLLLRSELAGADETPGLKPPGFNETLVSLQPVLLVSLKLTLSCSSFPTAVLWLLKSCLSQVQLLN